jgi:UDP-glucose 4-epimerase
MNCLVTGGAGFIGSTLVDKLILEGHSVVIFDNLSTGNEENINDLAEFYSVDISNTALLDTGWFEKIMVKHNIEVVFHTAALARVQPSIENPTKYNISNVNGTLNILKSASDAGVKRVVYSASSSAYGDQIQMPLVENMPTNPLSPYGLQKLIGEQYCKLFSEVYDLETISLRYFNVYGDRQNLSVNLYNKKLMVRI